VHDDGSTTELRRVECEIVEAPPAQPVEVDERFGLLLVSDQVATGYSRIHGRATCPNGVSSIEVFVDGTSQGRARVGLPSGNSNVDHPDDSINAFEAVIECREPGTTAVSAVVREIDGGRFELPPVEVEVVGADEERIDPWRGATLQARVAVQAARPADPRLAGAESCRMLVFTHDLGLGGGQLYLQELLRRLHGDDTFVTVVSPTDGRLRVELESLGIPVHVTGPWPVDDSLAYEGRMAEFAAWASAQGFTAVLGNTMLAFPGIDLARRMEIPAFWAIHESFPLEQLWMEAYPPGHIRPHVRECAVEALGWAEAVIFEAAATLELYEPYLSPGAGRVVPYGVDVSEIDQYRQKHDRDAVREQLGLAVDDRVVLCLGTIEPRKAQIALARAFVDVDASSAVLALVGAQENFYVDTLREYVEMKPAKRVKIIDITPNTYDWYLAADLFVCASDVESLPRSILEAMAFEVPVLATSVFGIPELIEHGRNGLLCEPRDVSAMRDALQRALDLDGDSLQRIGRAGSADVRSIHAPERYATEYQRMLSSVKRTSSFT
jgi:glycosyltransferase involved in cell wall biosynthesis